MTTHFNYFSQVFDPLTLSQAKDVVLTPDPTNPNKFLQETNRFVEFITKNQLILSTDKVLDFGCGMGRISKGLIDQLGCVVVGLDPSLHMQIHALVYVDNNKFDTVSSYDKCDIDVVIASLVLQHTKNPELEINNIYNVLRLSGKLIVANESTRYVPIGVDNEGFVQWLDDGVDIIKLLSNKFKRIDIVDYPNAGLSTTSIWMK
jgi:SAM-dependent methyltransferase